MSQAAKSKQFKEFGEYECGGNGPRPPVPGEESSFSKMTTEDASSSSVLPNQSPAHTNTQATLNRIARWQEQLAYLLADQQGVDLLFQFVKDEAGSNSIDYIRLKFYFACEGLKQQSNDEKVRKLIRAIYSEYIRKEIPVTIELRNTIKKMIKNEIPADAHLFDDLQKNVEHTINTSIYPTFLQSDVFIAYVEQIRKEQISQCTGGSSSINYASCSNSSIRGVNTGGVISSSSNSISSSTSHSNVTVAMPSSTISNLQTLHEDTELSLTEDNSMKSLTDRSMPKRLTKDLLWATQKGRLEVRPEGAHGYNTYKVSFNSSFNPVSCRDSERQSCSSASLTDSEVNSKDGKPYMHRIPTTVENYRRAIINPETPSLKTVFKPTIEGFKETVEPLSKSRMEKASHELNPEVLTSKLNALKQQMEKKEYFDKALTDRLKTAQLQTQFEDDDQSILDQHITRVFSPYLSPGSVSPRHVNRPHHRSSEMSSSLTDFVTHAMRHSKSIPEHASTSMVSTTTKKLAHNKCTLMNIDSGIDSLYSANLPYKFKDMKSIEQLSGETVRKSSTKDDMRRMRKQMPLASNPSSHQTASMSSSHHTNSLPRVHDEQLDYTNAIYTFGDEKIPYSTKIPGRRLTLKHFKEFLPKKGNFRFFFTTHCDDPDNPVIQEEVVNDADQLPLYEGKIKGTIKPE